VAQTTAHAGASCYLQSVTVALVPDPPLELSSAVARLARVLAGRRVVVLSGAGISTESGIPDYRGPETARRARNPIRFQAFVAEPAARARYWARSSAGWSRIEQAVPNAAHRAVAALERAGVVTGVLTQNVDRLHQRAGSTRVVELHGSLFDVRCLSCGAYEPRTSLQARLTRLNPGGVRPVEIAPDGDAEIGAQAERSFRVVGCLSCGGSLKPDVVFFGENVPRPRVERAYEWLDQADALLVVGSSLTVFSGFRFVKRAHAADKPVAILNVGPTRADALAAVKVQGRAGAVLPALARELT